MGNGCLSAMPVGVSTSTHPNVFGIGTVFIITKFFSISAPRQQFSQSTLTPSFSAGLLGVNLQTLLQNAHYNGTSILLAHQPANRHKIGELSFYIMDLNVL